MASRKRFSSSYPGKFQDSFTPFKHVCTQKILAQSIFGSATTYGEPALGGKSFFFFFFNAWGDV